VEWKYEVHKIGRSGEKRESLSAGVQRKKTTQKPNLPREPVRKNTEQGHKITKDPREGFYNHCDNSHHKQE